MKIAGDHYWQVRENRKFRNLVKKHGDPGFTPGKAYLEIDRRFDGGYFRITLKNDIGENIGMEAQYLKKAKR